MPLLSESPGDRSLERMMVTIPGFKPRGHGTYIFGRKELTAEMCDCKLCLYYKGKRKGCSKKRCPCIEERIYAGAASRKEVLTELAAAVKVPSFRNRILQHLNESEEKTMDFRNENHRIVFTEAVRKMNNKDYAVLYFHAQGKLAKPQLCRLLRRCRSYTVADDYNRFMYPYTNTSKSIRGSTADFLPSAEYALYSFV